MTSRFALPAFTACGLELEYVIVNAATLDVAPIAQSLLARLQGGARERAGRTGWSNELVSHVVELKNPEPTPTLGPLQDAFQREVRAANRALEGLHARLMPSGMHPWMDPRRETKIWNGSDAAIYAAYDRLFDCRRHGWANLQSMHINLPFAGNAEFARLHTAIRLVLPLIPALAASSPFADGAATGFRDYRLAVYETHASRFPSITGDVVPDVASSRSEYERTVLSPMYEALLESDPDGILRHEWLNARGAIARFDRSAIEIRLADVQECPRVDIAIAAAISTVVQSLYEERRSGAREQAGVETAQLARLLRRTLREAEEAIIDEADYLAVLGLPRSAHSAREVWTQLLAHEPARLATDQQEILSFILARGTLATRLLHRVGEKPARPRLHAVYADLCDCLEQSRLFS